MGEAGIPDVYVGVVLVRGRVTQADGTEAGEDPGRPSVRVGYAKLKVERKSKRLTVEVTRRSATQYRPREKVKVALRTADWKGAPVPAEVTVWAVDEGVLRLTAYEAPDPLDALQPERGLSVRIGEPLIHLVRRTAYAEKGMTSGGGGGAEGGGGIRSQFKTTVLFAPGGGHRRRREGGGRVHPCPTTSPPTGSWPWPSTAATAAARAGSSHPGREAPAGAAGAADGSRGWGTRSRPGWWSTLRRGRSRRSRSPPRRAAR